MHPYPSMYVNPLPRTLLFLTCKGRKRWFSSHHLRCPPFLPFYLPLPNAPRFEFKPWATLNKSIKVSFFVVFFIFFVRCHLLACFVFIHSLLHLPTILFPVKPSFHFLFCFLYLYTSSWKVPDHVFVFSFDCISLRFSKWSSKHTFTKRGKERVSEPFETGKRKESESERERRRAGELSLVLIFYPNTPAVGREPDGVVGLKGRCKEKCT